MEEIESDLKKQEPELQKSIIRSNCFKQLDLKVEREGFVEYIRKTAFSTFGEQVDEAMLDSYVNYVMQNEESSKQMMEQMTDEMLKAKLLEVLPVKHTQITASEFRKL